MKWPTSLERLIAQKILMLEELDNRIQKFELVESLVDFIVDLRYEDLPVEAIEAAQVFIMDTIAVGIAGTTYDATDKALSAAKNWGEGNTRMIGRPGETLARPSAAFVNGMQVHALEWDGLHEPSVVIAMCVPISAVMAEIDHRHVGGKSFILATVIAIEVAVFFGGNTTAGPRFFRPSIAGGMGATAALAVLRGFKKEQVIHALGLAHSQTAGTMQAHWEGSMALPMQIGNAARMAHLSVDMIDAGMTGPVDFIDGRFGFFKLFESVDGIGALLNNLGKPFKITEMAHKPYPAGRATQATLTMIRQLRDESEFTTSAIKRVRIYAPPLVIFLVGRPPSTEMTPSYARLCLRFVAPLMLIDGDIDPRRYVADMFSNAEICALGEKIDILADGNSDKNALGPQRMEIDLADGRTLNASCIDPLGSPANPLSKIERENKIRLCFSLGLEHADPQELIDLCNSLVELEDCKALVDIVSISM
jgi:2-methylcitrate dehydratase PrpD